MVSEQDRLEASYRDYLQAPLQPLQDNLESATYEVFEKDATKYELYSEAVYRTLLDRKESAQGASSSGAVQWAAVGGPPDDRMMWGRDRERESHPLR